ncbi:MAG: succinate dehydrogenase assembly factor 2 [Endozoicomonadaceae bacterium]|nr:succinate dehydrogenase assembly factor 2 [Endozoicomonadaceae bacterium]
MTTQEEMNRLFWHSRRGMLELDILLVPFAKNVYPSLSEGDQQRYVKLLTCEDVDLLAWFMAKEIPEDEEIAHMIQMILDHARTLSAVH